MKAAEEKRSEFVDSGVRLGRRNSMRNSRVAFAER
jgi:hypothetical protein